MIPITAKQTSALLIAAVAALVTVVAPAAFQAGTASADEHCTSEGGIYVCNSKVEPDDDAWPIHGDTTAERSTVAQSLADLACTSGLGWQTLASRVVTPARAAQAAVEAMEAVEAVEAQPPRLIDPDNPEAGYTIPVEGVEGRAAVEARPAVEARAAVIRDVFIEGADIPELNQRFNIEYRHIGTRFESGPHVMRDDEGYWRCARDGSRYYGEVITE